MTYLVTNFFSLSEIVLQIYMELGPTLKTFLYSPLRMTFLDSKRFFLSTNSRGFSVLKIVIYQILNDYKEIEDSEQIPEWAMRYAKRKVSADKIPSWIVGHEPREY